MQLNLTLDIPPLPSPISYTDKVLLIGSCFTEHMSDRLGQHKFKVLSNPHGILFNPLSVSHSLNSYLDAKQYAPEDLFHLNELWNSWDHHTRFSDIEKGQTLYNINNSQRAAAAFIKEANWVMITLGSAYQYYLQAVQRPVANNHRAPAQWFDKKMLTTEDIVTVLSGTLAKLFEINPNVQVMFTISPVRHIRDGVINNSRSKARLIDAVHTLCERFSNTHYFPAYEILIDILRDYRYYDIDFVHPNYMATSYVWEQFVKSCIAPDTQKIMQEVQEVVTARSHRPRFPQTEGHAKFKSSYVQKVTDLLNRYPYLDLQEELKYFSS